MISLKYKKYFLCIILIVISSCGGSSSTTAVLNLTLTSTSTATSPLDGRKDFAMVWTGDKAIIWGGDGADGSLGNGASYDPLTNQWTILSSTGSPSARSDFNDFDGIWTGDEMIIWGGRHSSEQYYANDAFTSLYDGARYNPNSDTWLDMSTTEAIMGSAYLNAVWTDDGMILFGGNAETFNGTGLDLHTEDEVNPTQLYNPNTDTWITATTVNAPTWTKHGTALWTGTQLFVWGGDYNHAPDSNRGYLFTPGTNTWAEISTEGAPTAREYFMSVWTGTEVIIWGGTNGSTEVYNDGARYNPATNTWTSISSTNAPAARALAQTVWTGDYMIFWGGTSINNGDYSSLGDGGIYDPVNDLWQSIPESENLSPRTFHNMVWTGSEVIIFGGISDIFDTTATFYNDGMILTVE